MFTGLSAFPLTPLVQGEIDEKIFVSLIERLVTAGVHSIGALGSTGSYAYLTREQRLHATRLAVGAAAGVPVMTSIGSINADEVLRLAEDAQMSGVSGLLLAPLSYQKLTADEVFRLYERVAGEISVPLCIYDNPATSGFEFSDELLVALSFLRNMGSIKLGDLPPDLAGASARVAKLKSQVAEGVTIGISGDAQSANGLLAGCDVWYSVLGGLFPHYSLRLTQAALRGDADETQQLNSALEPLWVFFRRHGSLRVIATVAELTGRVAAPCLPFPLQTLAGEERHALQMTLGQLPLGI
ncbi:dihydrodipicolinate synthase family protein [Leclercia tamurae]|uniref:dihydrodipicolinate synthase family protein n=1 Tax=Leclercia tamurae TaxID=2926467 RepID=UPI0036F4AA52